MDLIGRASADELRPLVELCKAGRLFDVQSWIASGKPLNISLEGRRQKSPLEHAIDLGFHSLVEILVKGGAEIANDRYNALEHAVENRRLDLAELLIAQGAEIHSVRMADVFRTYDPQVMEYFIERGADVSTDNPLAQAFCTMIYPALRIYKRYQSRFPGFQEQANIALRYHCKQGNQKWIALMLWAGADPNAKGLSEPHEDPNDSLHYSALELAALMGHHEVFDNKRVRLDPRHPQAFDLMKAATYRQNAELFTKLLNLGFPYSDEPNGGSSLYRTLLQSLSFSLDLYSPRQRKNIDSPKSRTRMKMVHLIAKQGAKWIPTEEREIGSFRREFLAMTPDYIAEFVWIMKTYQACDANLLIELLRTPSVRKHVGTRLQRVEELLCSKPQDRSQPQKDSM